MAYSYVTFTGDGSDTTYSFAGISGMFSNSFLSFQSQLDVYVNGILLTPGTDWSVTDTVSKIITFTTAPANGALVKIARDTKKDALLHSFSDGSITTARDLNNNTQQIFFNIQELVDAVGDSVGLVPAGNKWDFEGKPTFNGAPAVDQSGFTTLAQVNALLQGASVGTFDSVDTFKFTGNGITSQFDLTGITKAGLTADAVIVQINGIMQDPDVFSPSHTPVSLGVSNGIRWKKLVLPFTDFQSGSSYNPVISPATTSTMKLHDLDAGEVITRVIIDQTQAFTGGLATFELRYKDSVNLEDGNTHLTLIGPIGDPWNQTGSLDSGDVFPIMANGNGYLEIVGTFSSNVASLAAGSITVWIRVESESNNVTSVAGGSSNSVRKYTLSYSSGTPRITFNSAPASGDVIIVRVLSGTFQGYIADNSIGSDQIVDDAVGLSKINVGAGSANRILIFDANGDPTASIPSASLISNFDTQVRTSRLDQMAVPTGSVSLNNQKITNLAVGTDASDAVNKGQLDAALGSAEVFVARSSGHSVPANTPTSIPYPSGFSTYPKIVVIRLLSSASIAYGTTSGSSTDTVVFYTAGGTTEAKVTSNINLNTGSHTGVWIEVTGTTSGITIKHNSGSFTHCDVIWFK